MISGKRGWMVLPGLLLAAGVAAQAPSGSTRKQLHALKDKVAHQQATASDLKQQVTALQQRTTAEKAALAARDQEIARLKAALSRQAPAPATQGSSKRPAQGH